MVIQGARFALVRVVLGSALNPTGTLSLRHLEQFFSAIDNGFVRNCRINHLSTLIWMFMQNPRDPQNFNGG